MTPRSSCPGGDHSPPGRKPPAQLRINKVTESAVGISRVPLFLPLASATAAGSLLESTGGSVLARAEVMIFKPPCRLMELLTNFDAESDKTRHRMWQDPT